MSKALLLFLFDLYMLYICLLLLVLPKVFYLSSGRRSTWSRCSKCSLLCLTLGSECWFTLWRYML